MEGPIATSTSVAKTTTTATTSVAYESTIQRPRGEGSTQIHTQSGANGGAGRGQPRRRPNPNSRPTTPGNIQRSNQPNVPSGSAAEATTAPLDSEQNRRPPRQRTKRNPNTNRNRAEGTTNTNSPADSGSGRSTPRPNPHPNASRVITTNMGEGQETQPASASQNHFNQGGSGTTNNMRPKRDVDGSTPNPNPRNRQRKEGQQPSSSSGPNSTDNSTSSSKPPPAQNRRRANFGSSLTKPDSESRAGDVSKPKNKPQTNPRAHLPQGDDLTSSLIRALSTPPFPDCLICFSPLRPEQAIWSCSPSLAVLADSETGAAGTTTQQQYCWKSFHVKCIRSWAEKSVKDVREAWRARGEEKSGEWRCPGCQVKREAVPSGYWCFCNSTSEPKPNRLSTPHSCGNTCSRPRLPESQGGCAHPCPLTCHPGPCPPCQVTTSVECPCPRRETITFRCGGDAHSVAAVSSSGAGTRRMLTCGNTCGRLLGCGKHRCEEKCHEGDCGRCEVREEARCWCGREHKEVRCGEGEGVVAFVETEGGKEEWVGRFGCDAVCDRPFDCQIHKCQKSCHTPSSKPAHCPLSPDTITHCPCGKSTIAPPSTPSGLISQFTFPPRKSCTSPIPTCKNKCFKPHLACGHACEANCHDGPCLPCTKKITRPCRCGISVKEILCWQAYEGANTPSSSSTAPSVALKEKEFLCDKPCPALRACGRHQCRRLCCPLAQLGIAAQSKKGKRRANPSEDMLNNIGVGEESGGLHECDLVCGKMLSCGNHRCDEKDHKGPCKPCLRSSFEEAICPCGRTILDPPIPCGTVIKCPHACPIPMNPGGCGHRNSVHPCHDLSVGSCPPCVMLRERDCACGKRKVMNVRCSLAREKIGCGVVCGKLMSCGFHPCERLCHADPCGPCTSPCGKSRKGCLPAHHPCTLPCHAPASCEETEPCMALVQVTCPCGRLRQSVRCNKKVGAGEGDSSGSSSNTASSGTTATLKCSSECHIAKRNARLADALGIAPEKRDPLLVLSGNGLGNATANANGVAYSDELVAFARANMRFLGVVEKALREFVGDEGAMGPAGAEGTGTGIGSGLKKQQVLPHMTPERRKFVHDLAVVYRMDTQMVDVEPNRSVQIIRRVDTRIPNPTLSSYIASLSSSSSNSLNTPSSSSSSLGKLADLRTLRPSAANTASAFTSSSSALQNRGWTSIVSRPTPTAGVKQSASAWLQQPVESLPATRPSWRSANAGVDAGSGTTAGAGAYRHPHSMRGGAAQSSNSGTSGNGSVTTGAAATAGVGVGPGGGSGDEDVPSDWEDDL